MKAVVLNVWCPKIEDAVGRLQVAGVKSAEFIEPWCVWNRPEHLWAIQVVLGAKAEVKLAIPRQLDILVGWICGVVGVPLGASIDFDVVEVEEPEDPMAMMVS